MRVHTRGVGKDVANVHVVFILVMNDVAVFPKSMGRCGPLTTRNLP